MISQYWPRQTVMFSGLRSTTPAPGWSFPTWPKPPTGEARVTVVAETAPAKLIPWYEKQGYWFTQADEPAYVRRG